MSEEHKKNLSEKLKGRSLSQAHKENISNARKGWVFSEETKAKIAEANRGGTRSEESKDKMRQTQLRVWAEAKNKNILLGMQGKHHSKQQENYYRRLKRKVLLKKIEKDCQLPEPKHADLKPIIEIKKLN